jgi:Putative Actinobacterial Holin-X, holin superfamily III
MVETNEAAHGGRGTGQNATVAELARQLPEQISRLVREELRLAQLEMTQKGKRAGIGAGMLGGGGVIALYGVAAVVAAAIFALTLVLPAWASALIVGGALLLVSAALAGLGRKRVKQAMPPVPQQTQASVEADVEEIKERVQR